MFLNIASVGNGIEDFIRIHFLVMTSEFHFSEEATKLLRLHAFTFSNKFLNDLESVH